jgi:hypothetical protein
MSHVIISKAAAEKILKESERVHATLLVSRLLYYNRSYSTLGDGRTIEYGPGLVLSFIISDEARDKQYLPITLGRDRSLVLAPAEFFQTGTHSIDWVDENFTLTSAS